jgi:tetratricopeptide (TPR) repeat protein
LEIVPPALMLLCALAGAPSPHLSEGIRLYKAQNYAEALEALTRAIDEPNSKHDKARIHVYIGLIQFRFSMKNDASSSFEQALDYDPKIELKKQANPAARRLFAKIKRERFGDEAPRPRKERKKKKNGEEPGEAHVDPDPDLDEEPPPQAPPTIAVVTQQRPSEAAPPPPTIDPPPPPPPPITAVVTPEEDSVNVPAWITVSAGGAAVIIAGVLGGLAVYNSDKANEPGTFADEAESRYQHALRLQAGSIASGAIGAVGIGLGVTLFLIE